MKNLLKKGWFWLIIIIVAIIVIPIVIAISLQGKEKEKEKNTFESMSNGVKEFYDGKNNAKSHLDEFVYNNETGEVEYHPQNK